MAIYSYAYKKYSRTISWFSKFQISAKLFDENLFYACLQIRYVARCLAVFICYQVCVSTPAFLHYLVSIFSNTWKPQTKLSVVHIIQLPLPSLAYPLLSNFAKCAMSLVIEGMWPLNVLAIGMQTF